MSEISDAPKACFAPETDAHTRILILGSLPGEASLAANQYYAHPRNQFWRLIGDVLDQEILELPYAERLALLKENRIGLWDTVRSARRRGSLDSNIQLIEASPLNLLLEELPSLRLVAFNGGKAASIGQKMLADGNGISLKTLPSSSPAHAVPYAQKREAWLALRGYL